MSSDLNGVGQTQQNQSQPQNNGQQQTQQAPAQNQPQQTQQPSTPQFNILPVNPQTGRVEQPQQTQQPSQQQSQADQFSAFRQSVAASLGVSLNDVPSDPAALTQIVSGGWQAAQKLRQMEQQGTQQQPPAQTQQQAPNPLQPKQMASGWERLVAKNAQGVYEPIHPNFQSVAADANYNEGVYIQRNNALNQGQMLPEQQQSVKEIVAQQLAKEREELRASMFMEANESKLYELNPDGSRRQQVNAQGQLEPVPSELGIEMRNAAQEIQQSGAQFQSQHDLAKYALKIAEGRLKIKQAQAQQSNGTAGNGPPSQAQPQYNDLAGLLRNHTQSGNQGGGNMNTVQQPHQMGGRDARADWRSTLAQMPDNLNGWDYLNTVIRN